MHYWKIVLLSSAITNFIRLCPRVEWGSWLAADLERQPWAVQVKAIPTASVPVVKVLADPSRLSGAISGNGEWLLYQQSITAASAVAAGGMIPMHQQHYENINFATVESGLSRYSSNVMPTKYQKTQPPWRGADVMNGLISVDDITFEGPEPRALGYWLHDVFCTGSSRGLYGNRLTTW